MRQYGDAETCGRFALETFTRLDTRDDLITNCYWALGSIARRRGDIDAAREQLTHATNLARTTQQPTYLARMLNELSWLLLEIAEYDEALVYSAEAEQTLATTASERDKVQVQLNRGLLYYRQQKWTEAELAWRHALNSAYFRQSGEIDEQARLAHNLGTVLLKQGYLVEAEAQFSYARQLRQELQDNIALANTTGSLAQVYAEQGKQDEASALLEEALQLLGAYPDDAFAQILRPQFETQLQDLRS
jgi:tetratricopeptide (TPR) repeat protein